MLALIATWFKANKLIGIVALVLAAIVIIGTLTHLIDAGQDQARDAGAQTERAATTGKVIENVQTANETRAAVRDERSRAAYDECVRSARNAENCERFLPE
jgi:hypothetical protein